MRFGRVRGWRGDTQVGKDGGDVRSRARTWLPSGADHRASFHPVGISLLPSPPRERRRRRRSRLCLCFRLRIRSCRGRRKRLLHFRFRIWICIEPWRGVPFWDIVDGDIVVQRIFKGVVHGLRMRRGWKRRIFIFLLENSCSSP